MVELESFFLALATSLISFILGVISTQLRDFLKRRAEKKELKEKFLDFFNSLTQVDNLVNSKKKALTFLYHIDKDIISRKLEMIFDIKYSPQTKREQDQILIYISECIEYATIRLEDEDWILLVGFFPFLLFDKREKNRSKKLDLRENLNKSEREILIDFLKHLENKFKKAKIIKNSKDLVNDTLIKKIRG